MARYASTNPRRQSTDSEFLAKDDPRFVNREEVEIIRSKNRQGGDMVVANLYLVDITPEEVYTATGKRRRPDYLTASKFYASDIAAMARIADAFVGAVEAFVDAANTAPVASLPVDAVAAEIARLTAENAALAAKLAPAPVDVAAEIARLTAENAAIRAQSVAPAVTPAPAAAPRTIRASGAASRNSAQAKLSRLPK